MTPALQQIRIACAEAVGWRNCSLAVVQGGQPFGLPPYAESPLMDLEGEELPHFESDPTAALTLCDWLAERGWVCRLENNRSGNWQCDFFIFKKLDLVRYRH